MHQLTDRVSFDWDWNTEDEYTFGVNYEITKQVYIIGNCNVGKSTFINKLIDRINNSKKTPNNNKNIKNFDYNNEIINDIKKNLDKLNMEGVNIDTNENEEEEEWIESK